MQFKDYMELSVLCEGIYAKDNKLHFDYSDTKKKQDIKIMKLKYLGYGIYTNDKGNYKWDAASKVFRKTTSKSDYTHEQDIDTQMGKGKFKPFQSNQQFIGVDIHSVYKVDDATTLLKAIKYSGHEGIDRDSKDYQHFIKRTAIYVTAKILKDIKPDYIITPQSSSPILNDLLDVLRDINPHIKFLAENFKKVIDIDKIEIDDSIKGLSPASRKSIERVIKNAKKDGYFQIKKIANKDRKFVKNYLELIDTYKYNKLEDKNVVLLDDVLSSGSTFKEMRNHLMNYGIKRLSGVTIFKTSK